MFQNDIKILVVDDQGVMRKLIKKFLGDLGFTQVVEADDGATAWPKYIEAIAEDAPFKLVICDWNMPRMNGLELLAKVRASKVLGNTPFIMLTAESENHQVDKATQLKVSAYIKKPFTPDTLFSKMQEVYDSSKAAA